VGGWQVAPIITVQSGQRVTPTTTSAGSSDASLTGVEEDRPNLIGNPYLHGQGRNIVLNKASFVANTAGTYGDTKPFSLVGPTYADVDGAITRYFPLPESMQLEFRSECFDCFNHPNLPGPTAALNSSNFGKITTTTPYTPRILQFSLKLDF
jgi:hypothetical protein